jgi:hypothetical protein
MTRSWGRRLPWLLAGTLGLEAAVGLALHRSPEELAAAARSGDDVHRRAVALYRLANRGDGSALTPELLDAARTADPRLTVLVETELDRDRNPGARLRRSALAARAASPEAARYLELMLNPDRTPGETRELLSLCGRVDDAARAR